MTIKTAMVFVPHQDDEVSVAGVLIRRLRQQKTEVWVCYTTNGDYEVPVETRLEEAISALELLGVPADHIIMLGYPDRPNEEGFNHIYYQPKEKEHYLQDLKATIKKYMPDMLIGTDMDKHIDHRMLSLLFDKAVGQVLADIPEYKPVVWKAFSYGTGFGAPNDYWNLNIPNTVKPITKLRDNGERLDNPFYEWEQRIRIPVMEDEVTDTMTEGILYRALDQHESQLAILSAESILNTDQVFWERRTDNLLRKANIQVSSGDSAVLNDFMLYDASEIHEEDYVQMTGLWKPEQSDLKKEIKIVWKQKQTLGCLSIWGIGHKVHIEIEMGKFTQKAECENLYGEYKIPLNGQECETLTIRLHYPEESFQGIGEIEVFEPQEPSPQYIQLLADGQMTDLYYTWCRIPTITVYEYCRHNLKRSAYRYSYEINGKPVDSLKEVRRLLRKNRHSVITVYDKEHPEIRDQMTAVRLGIGKYLQKKKVVKEYEQEFQQLKQQKRIQHA